LRAGNIIMSKIIGPITAEDRSRRMRQIRSIGSLAFLALSRCLPSPPPAEAPRVDALTVVADVSSSNSVNDDCAEAAVEAREFLATRNSDRVEITVWSTGQRPSFEPVVLFDGVFEETHTPFAHGNGGNAVEAFLASLESSCGKKIKPAKDSPIYLAILRARTTIEARCHARADAFVCSRRAIAIMSDGRESVEATLKRAIEQPTEQHFSALKPKAFAADAELRISWCGLADFLERRRENAGLEAAWRIVLGSPNQLFSGTCRKDDKGARHAEKE
jgi:hypothetical protein